MVSFSCIITHKSRRRTPTLDSIGAAARHGVTSILREMTKKKSINLQCVFVAACSECSECKWCRHALTHEKESIAVAWYGYNTQPQQQYGTAAVCVAGCNVTCMYVL